MTRICSTTWLAPIVVLFAMPASALPQEMEAALEERCQLVERLANRFVLEAPTWDKPADVFRRRGSTTVERQRLGFERPVRGIAPDRRGPLLDGIAPGPVSWHVAFEELLLAAAYRAWKAGRWAQASTLLERINRSAPDWELAVYLSQRVTLSRAADALRVGRLDEAFDIAQQAASSRFPGVRQAARRFQGTTLARKALVELERNRPQEARSLLQEAVRIAPDVDDVRRAQARLRATAEAALERARRALANGDLDRAWADYDQACLLWPDAPGIRTLLHTLQFNGRTLRIGVSTPPDLAPMAINRPLAPQDCLLRRIVERPVRVVRSMVLSEPGSAVDDWRIGPDGTTVEITLASRDSAGEELTWLRRAVKRYAELCRAGPVTTRVTSASGLLIRVPVGPPLWYVPPWTSFGEPSLDDNQAVNTGQVLAVTLTARETTRWFDRVQFVRRGAGQLYDQVRRGQLHAAVLAPQPSAAVAVGGAVPQITPITALLVFNASRPAGRDPAVRAQVARRARAVAGALARRYDGLTPAGSLFPWPIRTTAGTAPPLGNWPVTDAPTTVRLGYPGWLSAPYVQELTTGLADALKHQGIELSAVSVPKDRWHEAVADCDLVYWEYSWGLGELPLLAVVGRVDGALYGLPPVGPPEPEYRQLAALVRSTRDPLLWRRAAGTLEQLLVRYAYVVPLWRVNYAVVAWPPLLSDAKRATDSAESLLEWLPHARPGSGNSAGTGAGAQPER